MSTVSSFVQAARVTNRRVILLARGGLAADRRGSCNMDRIVSKTVATLLNLPRIALIVLGPQRSPLREIQPHVLSIPNLSIDFATLLPMVDIVVHHGEFTRTNESSRVVTNRFQAVRVHR